MKIGVFDSGIGGITVLTELRRRLPSTAEFVYLGDTAHVPYGSKSPDQIRKLCRSAAQRFKELRVGALVVACNTASSYALDLMQEVLGTVPVLGVVAPGAQAAAVAWDKNFSGMGIEKPILVLATPATVLSHAYRNALEGALKITLGKVEIDQVKLIEQSCPILVPLIENGWLDHPVLHLTLETYLKSYVDQFKSGSVLSRKAGVALLGCTHYPWIQPAIEVALPNWIVVNSAQSVVDSFEQSPWYQAQLRAKKKEAFKDLSGFTSLSRGKGRIEWIFTDPISVPSFAQQLL